MSVAWYLNHDFQLKNGFVHRRGHNAYSINNLVEILHLYDQNKYKSGKFNNIFLIQLNKKSFSIYIRC